MSENIPEAKHIRWEEIPAESLNASIDRQMVVGDKLMVARILLKKGSVVPMHQHHHEQLSHIQSGALHFSVGDREVTLRAGELLCIPPECSALRRSAGRYNRNRRLHASAGGLDRRNRSVLERVMGYANPSSPSRQTTPPVEALLRGERPASGNCAKSSQCCAMMRTCSTHDSSVMGFRK